MKLPFHEEKKEEEYNLSQGKIKFKIEALTHLGQLDKTDVFIYWKLDDSF